jgi:hypothetical protein
MDRCYAALYIDEKELHPYCSEVKAAGILINFNTAP